MTYDFHRYANIFPLMEGEAFERLAADILDNGLIEPVVLYDGAILDGRNRYRACQHVGVPARFVEYDGDNPLGFVISKNRHRRHLTSSQLAAIAVQQEELMAELAAEARARQGTRTDLPEIFQESAVNGETSDHVADLFGTNPRYIYDAKRLKEAAPDLLQQVAIGELTIPEAKREHKERERQERRAEILEAVKDTPLAPPAPPYTLIYADPPWRYEHVRTESRAIENQYPTMALEDICALPVQDIADEDCVLFLWATNPKLAEAMDVIRAWGFTYRTNMVWVKDKIGMGYYARQQHELLLVAVKGAPGAPMPEDRQSSVIEAPRTEHSKKPDEFYTLIERLYPLSKKVELFARAPREGWAAWGNQL